MLARTRAYMARRRGFTREQRTLYDAAKKQGLTDRQVAEGWGISPSTLSRVKNKRGRLAPKTVERVRRNLDRVELNEFGEFRALSDTRITIDELLFLRQRGRDPRTRRIAGEALDRFESVQDEMALDNFEEVRQATVQRPYFYRTIKGKRVRIPLGRSKSDAFQREMRRQLRAAGLDPEDLYGDGEYLDFGGYGGVM